MFQTLVVFAFEPPFPFPSYFTLSFIPLPFMTPHTPWVLGPLGRWAALQVLGPRDQGPKLFVVQSMGKQRNKRKMAVSLLHLSKHSLLHGTFGLPWAMAARMYEPVPEPGRRTRGSAIEEEVVHSLMFFPLCLHART